MGLSSGSSSGQSQSAGYGYSTNLAETDVWGGQSDYLKNLYGQAQDLAGKGIDPQLTGAAQGGVDSLSRIAGGQTALDPYANPNSGLAKDLLAGASADIADNFKRVTIPGLNSAAGAAGGLGGSRDMLARGFAASDAQRQIADAGTSIYSNIWSNAAQAAAGKTDAQLSAASALPGAAMSTYGAQWGPLAQLAGILGGPTVLSKAYGQSENWNSSKSTQKSSQFGFNLFG